jgi:predicted metal-dependent hydrolase
VILSKKLLRKHLNFQIKLDSKILLVDFIQKSRQKHCYLRLKDKNKLQVSANKSYTLHQAKALIESKKNWIISHLEAYENQPLNNEFYYLGKRMHNSDYTKDEWYAIKAKEILPSLVQKHASLMQLFPSKLGFRKNKTRFGSCSSKNAISLNILLMKFPLEVIEYVIIHELAHIRHKNHSKAFWHFVEQYCPEYKRLDKALKGFIQPF